MTYRFYITIGSSQVEVHPLNFLKTSLVDSQESGERFYRRKFNGTLRFIGDDFDLIYMVEQVDPCTELILTIEQRDSGAATYHTYWTGYFTTMDGRFDLDNCSFDITPKPLDNYSNFDKNGEAEYNILAPVAGLTEVTVNTNTQNYTHNRWLVDVIEYLVQNIEPTATVVSWMFNNPNNYVTGGVNKYQHLTIAQKSDIKRPDATNPATIAMLSFNQLMEILRQMYNVFWVYDGSVFRIEHISYWDNAAGIDLRTQALAQRQNKYVYLKEDMPISERFSFSEASDTNFTTHTITYNSVCASGNKTEVAVNVTTDLQYIIDSVGGVDGRTSSEIKDEGWVILANELQDGNYYVYRGLAYENSNSVWNYPNSWSYLLRAFFRHDRILKEGYINSALVSFISIKKNRQQEIAAVVCHEDGYDPNDYITTELGETWFGGQKGYVKQATIHPDGRIEFTLVYGEDTNEEAVMPTPPKTIQVFFNLATDPNNVYIYLSEPNTVDMVFWIYWDSTDCQEITVPAGVVYQAEPKGYTGAATLVEFYTDDPSLEGWDFRYNTEEVVLTTSPPCPAAPPVPPAVPAAPVANGVTQLGLCDPLVFTWGAVAGATFYKVFRKPDADLLDVWEEQSNEWDTTFEDYWAGTQNGVTFTFKVQACNISGCSADSNEVTKSAVC